MRPRPEARAARGIAAIVVLALGLTFLRCAALAAQQQDERPEVVRALELESAGKYREAAALFRGAIRTAPSADALLGLERVYAELGMSDSLLAPLDTLIGRYPRETVYRTVQLRTLQILRRDDRLRDAFEKWVRADPREPSPYREYARILLQLGRPSSADSIVARGRVALGGIRDLEYENAQARAAMGEWVPSAQAWRRALADAPHLASAAAYSLAPAPTASRDAIRDALAVTPAVAGPRRALAELELTWGRPAQAWEAVKVLRADTSAATMWEEFGQRAFDEERWAIAREALVAAVRVRYTERLAVRAAEASVRAGVPADVFTIAPLSNMDYDLARAAREFLPVHVSALVALGRASAADSLIARYDRYLVPALRMRLAQLVATAWVRAGNVPRAREALRAAGPEADSTEAAGWLALYEGRLASARSLLRSAHDANAELALAMGIVARAKGDDAPELGAAFLTLARGDSASAATKFIAAAQVHPEVAPALLLTAARLRGTQSGEAMKVWERIVVDHAGTPEAAESELEWARALRKLGNTSAAAAHLEHLILSAPQSALLPQARRELELTRGTIPPT